MRQPPASWIKPAQSVNPLPTETLDQNELNAVLAAEYGYLDAKHSQGYHPRPMTPEEIAADDAALDAEQAKWNAWREAEGLPAH